KKALVCIRSGRLEEVQLYLEGMKTYIEKEDESEAHQLMYEEALMELKEDYLKDPDYLELMEQLIKVLEQEKHFGYIYFYREQITQAYRKQKKYKKAFEFQEEISSKMTMM
ncbi:MAG: XRE family transcriptional regulator, partial [Niameybacter sp.]